MKTLSKMFYSFILLIFFENDNLFAQEGWVTISPSNTFFSFSLPNNPESVIDSNGILVYPYQIDNDIALNCVFQQQDSSFASLYDSFYAEDSIPSDSVPDSIKNPLIVLGYLLLFQHDSASIIYINDIDTISQGIITREYAIAFFDDNDIEQNIYLRAYYNGHDMLTFSAIAPTSRSNDLIGYKNQFFDSVVINQQ